MRAGGLLDGCGKRRTEPIKGKPAPVASWLVGSEEPPPSPAGPELGCDSALLAACLVGSIALQRDGQRNRFSVSLEPTCELRVHNCPYGSGE